MSETARHDRPMTVLGGLAALSVLADAAILRAPGLALLAVPMLLGLALRRRAAGRIVMIVGGLFIAVVAAMYAASSGGLGDWPLADVIGVALGGPLAAVSALIGIAHLVHPPRSGAAHAH